MSIQAVQTQQQQGVAHLAAVDTLMNQLDSADFDSMSLSELEALVLKVQSFLHDKQKKMTKTVARGMEDAREEHLQETLKGYRGRKVMYMTLATGLLQLASGAVGLAPNRFFKTFEGLNNCAGGYAFELSYLNAGTDKGLRRIASVGSQALGGGGQMCQGLTGILQNKQQMCLTEHNAIADRNKNDKLGQDQDGNNYTSKIEQAKGLRERREDQRHQMRMQMIRGG